MSLCFPQPADAPSQSADASETPNEALCLKRAAEKSIGLIQIGKRSRVQTEFIFCPPSRQVTPERLKEIFVILIRVCNEAFYGLGSCY